MIWSFVRCAPASREFFLRETSMSVVLHLRQFAWFTAVSALGFAAPVVVHAQGFEGAITMRMAPPRNGPVLPEIEFLSRAGNVRVNVMSPAGSIAILGLGNEKKTYMLIESQRSYTEVSVADLDVAGAAAPGAVTVTKTGKKETVAGYECEHVIIASAANTRGAGTPTDVCVTRALGTYVNPLASLAGGVANGWQRQLTADGGFPLKVTRADGTVELEVTKIEKRRVSDSQFRIPAEFNKVDMPRRP